MPDGRWPSSSLQAMTPPAVPASHSQRRGLERLQTQGLPNGRVVQVDSIDLEVVQGFMSDYQAMRA